MGYTDRRTRRPGEDKICLVADWATGTKNRDTIGGLIHTQEPHYSIHSVDHLFCRNTFEVRRITLTFFFVEFPMAVWGLFPECQP